MDKGIILKISGLAKKYEAGAAVDRISFEVGAGKIIGLLGPNGAGKSTTINMILGILDPTEGKIEILGKDMKKQHSEIFKSVNFSAVYAHVPENLTVWQNLYVFGLLYEVKNLKEKIVSLVKEFDLENFMDTRAGLLSSGEISRLNLAKAVMNDPMLLLLDEPTASLDPSIAETIREKIKNYVRKSGAAVLWTSHNMREVEDVCDEVLFLSRGKILLSGNPRTLAAKHGKNDLEELFISVAREPLTFER